MILIKILRLKDYKPLSKTTRLDKLYSILRERERDILEHRFAVHLQIAIRKKIQNNVNRQRVGSLSMAQKYSPLSKKWREYKRKHKLKKGFWRAHEYLIKNIEVWKEDKVYYVGFHPDQKHPVNGQPLTVIATALEEGSLIRRLPKRGLFIPTVEGISRNIKQHIAQFFKAEFPQYLQYL